MKKYKTNQESIDKGILENLVNEWYFKTNNENKLYLDTDIDCLNKSGKWEFTDKNNNNFIVIKDNRIKGYCLKEITSE